MQKLDLKSPDLVNQNFEKLAALFPNCVTEGADGKAIAQDEPLRIVFKDSGFKDDTAKTNVKQLLKQLSPDTEMKVI